MAKPRWALLLRRFVLFFGVVAVGILLVQWVEKLIALDPFASFRNAGDGPLGNLVGVRMDNVHLTFYNGPTKIGSCRVARLDVQRNNQYLDFYGVTDGSYNGTHGSFQFVGDRAQWNAVTQRLQVMSGAKIKNKDMDLVADPFDYNQSTKLLYVKGHVRGKIFGGQVVAMGLTYSLDNGSYSMGPVKWTGMAGLSSQDTGDEDTKKSHWHFNSGKLVKANGGNQEWTNIDATDGEVIVKAPKAVRDVKTDVITATGNVFYFSAKTNMTCDKAVIYRKEKRAVLTGNVQMILKPTQSQKLEVVEIPPFKPQVPEDIAKDRPPAPPGKSDDEKKLDDEVRSGKTTRKYPILVLADNVEYWYAKGSRHAVITGSPQARQELAGGRWRYGWTHEAFYDGEKETLKLVSTEGKKDTRVKSSLGDDFVADSATVSTQEDNDEISADGISGDFFQDSEETPAVGNGKDTKKTGTGTGTGDKKGGGGDDKPPIKGPIGGGG